MIRMVWSKAFVVPGEEEKKAADDSSTVEMEDEEKDDDASFVAVDTFAHDQVLVAVEEERNERKLELQFDLNESESE